MNAANLVLFLVLISTEPRAELLSFATSAGSSSLPLPFAATPLVAPPTAIAAQAITTSVATRGNIPLTLGTPC